jgi:hypothetical protein
VLLASGLKLVGLSTPALGWALLALVFIGLPAWGVVDALQWRKEHWEQAGKNRSAWIKAQAAGPPAAIAYFTKTRPRLAAAAALGEATG